MKTTRVITNVTLIDRNVKRPIVVLQLDGFPDVVRGTQQMLTDLQNSGRIRNVRSAEDERFVDEVFGLIGATLTGDLNARKAGDSYTIDATHPDVVQGTAKAGDKRIAEKDGVWVEGFLSIPKTLQERAMKLEAQAYAEKRVEMQGLSVMFASFNAPETAVVAEPENAYVPAEPVTTEEQEIADLAFGTETEA